MNTLKKKLKNGEVSIGSWITFANGATTEIMAKSGFEWLAVDMEHTSISISRAGELIRVIDLAGVIPLVRIGANDPLSIKRVMDAGARGVIIPMVNSAAEAKKAVSSVKYPPMGIRGVGLARAQGYGRDFEKYKKWVNKKSVVIVQIEHIEGVNNLEKILSVKGVDASIVGPYDLSASMGRPGEFNRKEVRLAINRYLKVCAKMGKPAGFHSVPSDAVKVNKKIKEGFKLIAFGVDMIFLGEKIHDEMRKLGIGGKR